MNKMRSVIIIFLFFSSLIWSGAVGEAFAQNNNVGIGTLTPEASAALDVSSITKGLLLPRLTTAQRNAIPSPAQSLLIYNTTDSCYEGYIGNSWISLWCKNSCGYTTAYAGPDINPVCGVTTAALSGNTPTAGTGAWSVVSGTAAITTPNSPTSAVTGLVISGIATLRWTISNPPCTSSTDDVIITTASCGSCAGGSQTSGCGGLTSLTDSRDGKVYSIIQIGTQCWMTQNLNYGAYAAITSPQAFGTKFCQNLSGIDDASCPFGGLYEWGNMMNGAIGCNGDSACPPCITPIKGMCPSGWHIPSHYEWTLLEKNAGTNPGAFPYDLSTSGVWLGIDEGGNLKQTGTSNWLSPNTGATNTSGFLALPGGSSFGGSFGSAGLNGSWWSATESGGNAWDRGLFYPEARVLRLTDNKSYGFSVRCVKD